MYLHRTVASIQPSVAISTELFLQCNLAQLLPQNYFFVSIKLLLQFNPTQLIPQNHCFSSIQCSYLHRTIDSSQPSVVISIDIALVQFNPVQLCTQLLHQFSSTQCYYFHSCCISSTQCSYFHTTCPTRHFTTSFWIEIHQKQATVRVYAWLNVSNLLASGQLEETELEYSTRILLSNPVFACLLMLDPPVTDIRTWRVDPLQFRHLYPRQVFGHLGTL